MPQQYIHIYYLHKYYGNGEHFDCSFGIFSRIIFPRKNTKFTKKKNWKQKVTTKKDYVRQSVTHFRFNLYAATFLFYFLRILFLAVIKNHDIFFLNFLQIVRKIQLGLIFSKEFGIYQFVIITESTYTENSRNRINEYCIFLSNSTNKSNYIHNLQ